MIEQVGVDELISVDLHRSHLKGFFNCPVIDVNPRPLAVEYFKSKKLQNPIILSPDIGGI